MPSISVTALRQNLFKVVDQVLATGVPVEIERHGKTLLLIPAEPVSKLANLKRRHVIVGGSGGTCRSEIGLGQIDVDLHVIIRIAKHLTWTRDVFDRMIVATTMAIQDAQLITKDTMIRQHSAVALW